MSGALHPARGRPSAALRSPLSPWGSLCTPLSPRGSQEDVQLSLAEREGRGSRAPSPPAPHTRGWNASTCPFTASPFASREASAGSFMAACGSDASSEHPCSKQSGLCESSDMLDGLHSGATLAAAAGVCWRQKMDGGEFPMSFFAADATPRSVPRPLTSRSITSRSSAANPHTVLATAVRDRPDDASEQGGREVICGSLPSPPSRSVEGSRSASSREVSTARRRTRQLPTVRLVAASPPAAPDATQEASPPPHQPPRFRSPSNMRRANLRQSLVASSMSELMAASTARDANTTSTATIHCLPVAVFSIMNTPPARHRLLSSGETDVSTRGCGNLNGSGALDDVLCGPIGPHDINKLGRDHDSSKPPSPTVFPPTRLSAGLHRLTHPFRHGEDVCLAVPSVSHNIHTTTTGGRSHTTDSVACQTFATPSGANDRVVETRDDVSASRDTVASGKRTWLLTGEAGDTEDSSTNSVPMSTDTQGLSHTQLHSLCGTHTTQSSAKSELKTSQSCLSGLAAPLSSQHLPPRARPTVRSTLRESVMASFSARTQPPAPLSFSATHSLTSFLNTSLTFLDYAASAQPPRTARRAVRRHPALSPLSHHPRRAPTADGADAERHGHDGHVDSCSAAHPAANELSKARGRYFPPSASSPPEANLSFLSVASPLFSHEQCWGSDSGLDGSPHQVRRQQVLQDLQRRRDWRDDQGRKLILGLVTDEAAATSPSDPSAASPWVASCVSPWPTFGQTVATVLRRHRHVHSGHRCWENDGCVPVAGSGASHDFFVVAPLAPAWQKHTTPTTRDSAASVSCCAATVKAVDAPANEAAAFLQSHHPAPHRRRVMLAILRLVCQLPLQMLAVVLRSLAREATAVLCSWRLAAPRAVAHLQEPASASAA